MSSPPEPEDVAAFIATLGRVTGRTLTSAQQDLISRGLSSLLQLASDASGPDRTALIEKNIGLFLGYLQAALGLTLTTSERQQLTQALAQMSGLAT